MITQNLGNSWHMCTTTPAIHNVPGLSIRFFHHVNSLNAGGIICINSNIPTYCIFNLPVASCLLLIHNWGNYLVVVTVFTAFVGFSYVNIMVSEVNSIATNL